MVHTEKRRHLTMTPTSFSGVEVRISERWIIIEYPQSGAIYLFKWTKEGIERVELKD